MSITRRSINSDLLVKIGKTLEKYSHIEPKSKMFYSEVMKNIKTITFIGWILILLGIASIAIEQVSYTRHQKLIEIGPLEATIEKEAHCFRLPIIFGILVIASGLVIIFLNRKKTK